MHRKPLILLEDSLLFTFEVPPQTDLKVLCKYFYAQLKQLLLLEAEHINFEVRPKTETPNVLSRELSQATMG